MRTETVAQARQHAPKIAITQPLHLMTIKPGQISMPSATSKQLFELAAASHNRQTKPVPPAPNQGMPML